MLEIKCRIFLAINSIFYTFDGLISLLKPFNKEITEHWEITFLKHDGKLWASLMDCQWQTCDHVGSRSWCVQIQSEIKWPLKNQNWATIQTCDKLLHLKPLKMLKSLHLCLSPPVFVHSWRDGIQQPLLASVCFVLFFDSWASFFLYQLIGWLLWRFVNKKGKMHKIFKEKLRYWI